MRHPDLPCATLGHALLFEKLASEHFAFRPIRPTDTTLTTFFLPFCSCWIIAQPPLRAACHEGANRVPERPLSCRHRSQRAFLCGNLLVVMLTAPLAGDGRHASTCPGPGCFVIVTA